VQSLRGVIPLIKKTSVIYLFFFIPAHLGFIQVRCQYLKLYGLECLDYIGLLAKKCKEIVVVYFKVLFQIFSTAIHEYNKKPLRIFSIACKIRTVCLANTEKKSYIWKQRLNQDAPARNPSLQKLATELCHTPVDFSSIHNLIIIL